MLPAQDDTRPQESVSTLAENLAGLAAAKMFSPLDGLREQLEAISLEEIAAADQQIAKLLEHLQYLQRALDKIEKLRACQVEADIAKRDSTAVLENAKLEAENRPAPVQPLGNVAGLITLRGINKPSGPAQPSLATVAPFKSRIVPAPTVASAELSTPTADSDPSTGDIPPSGVEHLTVADTLAQPEGNAGPSEPSADSAPAAAPIEAHPATSETKDEEKTTVSSTHASAAPTADDEVVNEEPVDFDQKLLDDLIKNYGEFVASPAPQAAVEAEAPNPETTEKPRVTMHAVLGGRAADKEPPQRTQNEIDRQLKKIVKDYGDVDLYAQSGNLKTKLRVGAAFIVLATVLGGIYYFSKPKNAADPVADILQQRPSPAAAETLDKPELGDGTKDAEVENGKLAPDKNRAKNQPLQKKNEKGGTRQ